MSRNQIPNHSAEAQSRPEDYLTPEQRLDAIADVLAEITLEALENDTNP